MLTQIGSATTVLDTSLNDTLDTILKSRLFVYPEPESTYQQDEYNQKLEDGTYTSEDFHDQIFNHSKSPLTLKTEKWQDATNNGFGGLMALQTDLAHRRNQILYTFADKLAYNIKKNEIDIGIYIRELDTQIQTMSSECNILCGVHLRKADHRKNILIWDTLTTANNYSPSSDGTFGQYKLVVKLQWDFVHKSKEPCFGSVQIDECENLSASALKYYSIFVESFDDINDLEKNIKLLYNKLYELREDPNISH